MNLSIAILPENSKSADDTHDIYGALKIAPYIKSNASTNGRHYFTTLSKGRHYELDIFLLSQEPKYTWHNILGSPPKHAFTFDMGITLKGKIPPGINFDKNNKVRLYALGGINEYAGINENREFVFDHLIIQDSSWVNFTLAKLNEKNPKVLNIVPQMGRIATSYFKMHKPKPSCDLLPANPEEQNYSAPTIYKDAIELDEVTVEGKRLKYATSFGNTNLTGYRMEDYNMNNISILNWLRFYSNFDVVDNNNGVQILGRARTSINGASSGPIVYIDNVQQFDLSILRNILTSEVEEIYMNGQAIVPSVRNYMGVIKVYLKKGGRKNNKNSTPDIVVINAFQRSKRFENVSYASTTDKAFEDFGLIYWHPILMTYESGNFTFEMPKISQKTVKVIIEGFSADGKLISEVKTVTVQ